VCEEA